MRLQFLPGVLIAFISLLRTDAYAQMRDQSPTDWRTFEVPEFGTRIQVPASIFAPAGKPERGSGQRFERSDGRAALSIYSRPNDKAEKPGKLPAAQSAHGPRCAGLCADSPVFLRYILGARWNYSLQPLQFFEPCPPRDSLL